MRTAWFCSTCFLLSTMMVNPINAQEASLFSGAGLRTSPDRPDGGLASPSQRGRLFDFRMGQQPDPSVEKPAWPNWNLLRERGQSASNAPRWTPTWPKFELFPPRDPNQPNFFQKANARTREFFDRRSQEFNNWAQQTNQNWRNRTYETWDAITRTLQGAPTQGSNQPPAQPPLRTARGFEEQPKVRF